MYSCAVFCTDLSDASDHVIALAPEVAQLGVREAVLTHVVDVFSSPPTDRLQGPEGDTMFERQIRALEAEGMRVRVDVPVGHVSYSVEEVARRCGADLVVLGGRGLGIFQAAFSGSVSSDLVRISTRPVLLGLKHPDGMPLLERVLFPTDFSESAARAREALEVVVGVGVRSVHLLHVQDSTRLAGATTHTLRDYDTTDMTRLEKRRVRLLDLGADEVTTEIAHGHPSEIVAKTAASGEYTLVVMGGRGRTQTADRFLGSVSDAVIRRSACPVLLFPSVEQG